MIDITYYENLLIEKRKFLLILMELGIHVSCKLVHYGVSYLVFKISLTVPLKNVFYTLMVHVTQATRHFR